MHFILKKSLDSSILANMSLFTIKPVYLPNASIIPEKEEVKKPTNTISKKIGQLAYAIFLPINLALAFPDSTLSILKKMNRNIFPLMECLKNLPLIKVLESSIALINSVQLTAHIDYLANGKYIQESVLAIAGHIALCLSQTSESVLWILKTAGKTHLIVNGSLALSHFLFSIDNFCRWMQTENGIQQNQLKIELAKNSANCSLALAMIASPSSTPAIGLLAAFCIGLEVAGLIHKELQ
jgi:hypothetical protein